METRYSEKLRRIEDRLIAGPGQLDQLIRRSVVEGGESGDDILDAYVDKVRHHAYKIVDGDIEALKAAGWSEDQIYELSICAAFGAAKHRLDAGLRAIEQARTGPPYLSAGAPTGRA